MQNKDKLKTGLSKLLGVALLVNVAVIAIAKYIDYKDSVKNYIDDDELYDDEDFFDEADD